MLETLPWAQALTHHPFFRLTMRVMAHSRWLVLLALLPVGTLLLRRWRAGKAGAAGPTGRAT